MEGDVIHRSHRTQVQGREKEPWVLRCPAAVLREAARMEDGCDTQRALNRRFVEVIWKGV